MKLAEALALRAELNSKLHRLKDRAEQSARFQEGEAPLENSNELLDEARATLVQLEDLIVRINSTNAVASLENGLTFTEALGKRSALDALYSLLSDLANAAVGKGSYRQLRSELRYESAVDVHELRVEADRVAEERRQIDSLIQAGNWKEELQD